MSLLRLKARCQSCRDIAGQLQTCYRRYPALPWPATPPHTHTQCRLTVRTIESIRPSAERREIPDGCSPGSILSCSLPARGAGPCAIAVRAASQTYDRLLPAIDLKPLARSPATRSRAVAEGRDPGREKKQSRAAKADSIDRDVEDSRTSLQARQPFANRGGNRAAAPAARAAPLARTDRARDHPSRRARRTRSGR